MDAVPLFSRRGSRDADLLPRRDGIDTAGYDFFSLWYRSHGILSVGALDGRQKKDQR